MRSSQESRVEAAEILGHRSQSGMEWVQMGTKGYFALWLELAKTRGEITVEEIEAATSANRNIIKLHLKKLEGRGARYTIK